MSRPLLLSSTIAKKLEALKRVPVTGTGPGRPADYIKLADAIAIVKAHLK